MTTEALKKAKKKYESEKVEHIRVRVPIGKKDLIKKCADLNNESINAMVNRLLDQEIQRKEQIKTTSEKSTTHYL